MKNIWHKGNELPTISEVGQDNALVVVLEDDVFGGYYDFECGVFVPYYTNFNGHLHELDSVCYVPAEVVKWCKFEDLKGETETIEAAQHKSDSKTIAPLAHKSSHNVEVVEKLNEVIGVINEKLLEPSKITDGRKVGLPYYDPTKNPFEHLPKLTSIHSGGCDKTREEKLEEALTEIQKRIRKVTMDTDPVVELMMIDSIVFQAIGEKK